MRLCDRNRALRVVREETQMAQLLVTDRLLERVGQTLALRLAVWLCGRVPPTHLGFEFKSLAD